MKASDIEAGKGEPTVCHWCGDRAFAIRKNMDGKSPPYCPPPMMCQSDAARQRTAILNGGASQAELMMAFINQAYRCMGCQYHLPFHVITLDHLHPKSEGGWAAPDNYAAMCSGCNAQKGTSSMDDFLESGKIWDARNLDAVQEQSMRSVAIEMLIRQIDKRRIIQRARALAAGLLEPHTDYELQASVFVSHWHRFRTGGQ